MEREFETMADEQAKQSGLNKLGETVLDHSRDNDLAQSYYEDLRHIRLQQQIKLQTLEIAEREQALTEKRNKAFNQDLADKQALAHANYSFDRLNNLEPSEAVAQSNVLPSTMIEAIRGIVVETMKKA